MSVTDKNNFWAYGEAIVDRGICVRDAANPYGIVTFGLVWQLYDIWMNTTNILNISTSWSAYAGASISTTWTAYANGTSSTTWTPSEFGIYGEYSP